MHDYPLHAVETDVLLHEGDLLVELARRPGVEILSAEERLALLLSKQDCDGWLHDRIGDQNTPEYIQLLEPYLDAELLLSDLVEGILHEAASQGALRASGQGELFS